MTDRCRCDLVFWLSETLLWECVFVRWADVKAGWGLTDMRYKARRVSVGSVDLIAWTYCGCFVQVVRSLSLSLSLPNKRGWACSVTVESICFVRSAHLY